jgi:mRNA-degrading endonuclease RelE of RelBE toxin-antitoxin system
MVNEEFRERLDAFSARIDTYNNAINKFREQVIPSIIDVESKDKLHIVSKFRVHFTIRDKTGTINCYVTPFNCLEDHLYPRDFALRDHTNGEIIKFEFELGTYIESYGPRQIIDESIYTQFMKGCFEKLERDATYKFLVNEHLILVKDAKSIFEELTKRIEEPWEFSKNKRGQNLKLH